MCHQKKQPRAWPGTEPPGAHTAAPGEATAPPEASAFLNHIQRYSGRRTPSDSCFQDTLKLYRQNNPELLHRDPPESPRVDKPQKKMTQHMRRGDQGDVGAECWGRGQPAGDDRLQRQGPAPLRFPGRSTRTALGQPLPGSQPPRQEAHAPLRISGAANKEQVTGQAESRATPTPPL